MQDILRLKIQKSMNMRKIYSSGVKKTIFQFMDISELEFYIHISMMIKKN
jgi:hypothetical protein